MKRPFSFFRKIGVRVVGWRLCHRWGSVPVDVPAVKSWAPFVGKPPSVCIFRSFSLEVGSFRRYLSVVSLAGSSGALWAGGAGLGWAVWQHSCCRVAGSSPLGWDRPAQRLLGFPFGLPRHLLGLGGQERASRFRDLSVHWITVNQDSSASFQHPFNFVVFSWSLWVVPLKNNQNRGFCCFVFCFFVVVLETFQRVCSIHYPGPVLHSSTIPCCVPSLGLDSHSLTLQNNRISYHQ